MMGVQDLARNKHDHHHQVYAKLSILMGLGEQCRGEGSFLEDHRGKRYLALFDQYGNQAFGYSHPQFVRALRDKLDTGNINSAKIFLEEEHICLAQELAAATRDVLPYAYFANGGGETVDNAFKLARGFNRRPNIVSAMGCMHGKTMATLAASGRPEHELMFRPFMPGFQQVPFNDLDAMHAAVDERTSAVILEPVQAEAGVFVPDPGYLEGVRQICNQRGALLIFDEMQTAFGRLGETFAFQKFGVYPDMVCVGKAFGGGLLPISAVLGTAQVWAAIHKLPSSFGSSLGGNPLCCAVARSVLRLAQDRAFLTRVNTHARVIAERLEQLAIAYPTMIKSVRGMGMMHGVEFHDEVVAGVVLSLVFQSGVTSTFSLYNSRVLRVQPPMVISDQELVDGLDRFEAAISRGRGYLANGFREDAGAPDVSVQWSVQKGLPSARKLLTEDPHAFDPFSHPDSSPHDFAGWIGADPITWTDDIVYVDDGVRLEAQPCWLWRRLSRVVTLHETAPGRTTVQVRVTWDCNLGGYEGLANGKIGYFIRQWAASRTPALSDIERDPSLPLPNFAEV